MSAEPPADEALMARVTLGDRAAYECLYARWSGPVFGFLLRRTGSAAAAEDAHQETWLRLYRFRSRYDPARPFRPWLYRIASNAGNDARRPVADTFDPIDGPLPGNGDPLVARDLLVAALHVLEGIDRRILLLTIEGFNATEVAEMLDLGPGAVRMRLSRARQKIRDALVDQL